jgi:hypothetical protein
VNRTTLNETTPARPGAWRPGPFLLIQLALHGAALLQLMIYPQEWQWAAAIMLLSQLRMMMAAGLRNVFLDPVLHNLGLQLASWTRRGFDTRERDPEKVLQRLTHQLAAGDILLLHDGNAARTPAGEALIVTVLPQLLDSIRVQGLTPVTLAHACNLP